MGGGSLLGRHPWAPSLKTSTRSIRKMMTPEMPPPARMSRAWHRIYSKSPFKISQKFSGFSDDVEGLRKKMNSILKEMCFIQEEDLPCILARVESVQESMANIADYLATFAR